MPPKLPKPLRRRSSVVPLPVATLRSNRRTSEPPLEEVLETKTASEAESSQKRRHRPTPRAVVQGDVEGSHGLGDVANRSVPPQPDPSGVAKEPSAILKSDTLARLATLGTRSSLVRAGLAETADAVYPRAALLGNTYALLNNATRALRTEAGVVVYPAPPPWPHAPRPTIEGVSEAQLIALEQAVDRYEAATARVAWRPKR